MSRGMSFLGDFPRDEVALRGDHVGVLIGIFIHDIHIRLADQAQHAVIGRIDVALEGLHGLVIFIGPRRSGIVIVQQFVIDLVLDGIDRHGMAEAFRVFLDLRGDLVRHAFLINAARAVHGLLDSRSDLFFLERHFLAVAFDDFQHDFLLVYERPRGPKHSQFIIRDGAPPVHF